MAITHWYNCHKFNNFNTITRTFIKEVRDMAKKPQKEAVEEIVRNLVNSEISGIQAVARDMAERVKQLEAHSIRIKQYTDEIEKLAIEAASDKYDKAGLEELVKNLEKTIAKMRKKAAEEEEIIKLTKQKQGLVVSEIKPVEEKYSISKVTGAEDTSREALNRAPLYTTPEGFIVRKIRQ